MTLVLCYKNINVLCAWFGSGVANALQDRVGQVVSPGAEEGRTVGWWALNPGEGGKGTLGEKARLCSWPPKEQGSPPCTKVVGATCGVLQEAPQDGPGRRGPEESRSSQAAAATAEPVGAA